MEDRKMFIAMLYFSAIALFKPIQNQKHRAKAQRSKASAKKSFLMTERWRTEKCLVKRSFIFLSFIFLSLLLLLSFVDSLRLRGFACAVLFISSS